MGNREVVGDLQEKQMRVGKTKNKKGIWENKKGILEVVTWIIKFISSYMGYSLIWWVFVNAGGQRIVLIFSTLGYWYDNSEPIFVDCRA